MDKDLIISVVVPLYNKAAYVGECLDSLLAQTVAVTDELEVIVVDDCSTDDGVAVVEEYVQRDSRVRLVRLAVNGGPSVARNAGLGAARGKFIGFVDADDWIAPEMYEMLVDVLRSSPEAACVRCGQRIDYSEYKDDIFTERSYLPTKGSSVRGAELYSDLFRVIGAKPLLSVANALFRRSVIEDLGLRFEPEMRNLEDVLFNARLFATNTQVEFVLDPFYHIRPVAGSQSRSPESLEALKDSYRVLVQEIKQLQQENDIAHAGRRAFWVYRAVVLATIVRTRLHSFFSFSR